jgi:hypothetical protein
MGIELVGEVRGGLPSFELPDTSVLPHLLPAASGIALMSFVETAAAGKAFRNPDEPSRGRDLPWLAAAQDRRSYPFWQRPADRDPNVAEHKPQAVVIDCSAIPDFE